MNRRYRFLFCILLVSFLTGHMSEMAIHAADDSSDRFIWLTNAQIETVSAAGRFTGAIGIDQGKIVEVIDFSVDPSAKARIAEHKNVIDLSGKTVTPGLIDARGALWLEESAINASSTNAALDIVTGIDFYQDQWHEVARQGVTTVGIGPRGSLGGNSAAVSVGKGDHVDAMLLNRFVAVTSEIGLGANSSTARFQEFNRLKEAIKKAAAGEAASDQKEDDSEEAESDSEKTDESSPPQQPGRTAQAQQQAPAGRVSPPARTDELLKRVVKGELPLHVRARHSDVILRLIELADEFKIRMVLEQIPEADRWSDKIQQLQIPVVVGPFHPLSQSQSSINRDADFEWAIDYVSAGGLVAVSTFTNQPRGSRLLRLNLASLISKGLKPEDSLATVTINAARILGVADQVGSIEVGKRADLAVFAGNPLDPATPVSLVLGNGEILFQSELQVDLQSGLQTDSDPMDTRGTTSDSLVDADGDLSARLLAWPSLLPQKYAVRSKRIWYEDDFVDGIMVVSEGIIQSIGGPDSVAEVIASELPIFDAVDHVVTPGFVAAHSHLGHQSVLGGYDESDATLIRSVDVFDSQLKLVSGMRDGGFLHVGLAPVGDRTSSGSVGQIDLGGQIPTIVDPHIASQFVLSAAARDAARYPASLEGQLSLIRGLLEQRLPESRVYVSAAIARMLDQEKLACLQRVSGRQAKALFVIGDQVELKAALKMAEEFELEGSILVSSFDDGPFAGGPFAGDLNGRFKASGLGLIIPAATGNEYDRSFQDLAAVINSGISIGFAGETPEEIRATAALLSTYGASPQALLSGLTQAGGNLVGMKEDAGKLIPQSTADWVVWDRSPLDAAAIPLAIIVNGQIQPK